MAKVSRVQAVITEEENSDLIKECGFQHRKPSNLIRKYIIEGVKRDKAARLSAEQVELMTHIINS